jgi:hypothetical protein
MSWVLVNIPDDNIHLLTDHEDIEHDVSIAGDNLLIVSFASGNIVGVPVDNAFANALITS